MTPLQLGFLGAGQMATSLARAWKSANLIADTSLASDPYPKSRDAFSASTGLQSRDLNTDVVRSCNVLVLAVKPQIMPTLLREIGPIITADHLVISIAAGITIAQLSDGLGQSCRIIRVMPNTPCLVNASAAGFSTGPTATKADAELVSRLFDSVGRACAVPEHLLDAVTGLSGSGPAYIYAIIEALSDGGVRVGLPRDVATMLAAQTVLGAAKMVLETGMHPGALKDAVTSPGGTTIAGLHELERGGLRGILMNAVQAATLRATELGARK